MTLKNLINEMAGKPVLSTAGGFKAFKQSFDDGCDSPLSDLLTPPPYTKTNGVGVINFTGFVVKTATPAEEIVYGCVSLDRFCRDLKAMVADPEVTMGVIIFDSPGGYTMGLVETAQLVSEISKEKPLFAYSSGLMCSAAYRIACECNNIVASPSSYVGSIGSCSETVTVIGASQLGESGVTKSTLSNMGVIITTFQSGKDKTVGSPVIALDEEQEKQILNDIVKDGEQFRADVRAARSQVKDEFMTGAYFTGQECVELNTGLVDALANSADDFLEALLSMKV